MSDELTPAPEEEPKPATTLLTWNGVAVTVPAEVEDLDPDALEAFENDKAIGAIRAIMGSTQYEQARAEFEKKHGRRPTMRDINRLADEIAKHYGFVDAGN